MVPRRNGMSVTLSFGAPSAQTLITCPPKSFCAMGLKAVDKDLQKDYSSSFADKGGLPPSEHLPQCQRSTCQPRLVITTPPRKA